MSICASNPGSVSRDRSLRQERSVFPAIQEAERGEKEKEKETIRERDEATRCLRSETRVGWSTCECPRLVRSEQDLQLVDKRARRFTHIISRRSYCWINPIVMNWTNQWPSSSTHSGPTPSLSADQSMTPPPLPTPPLSSPRTRSKPGHYLQQSLKLPEVGESG